MKKIINIAVLTAVVAGAAGAAQAADVYVNMYGASAQVDLWKALLPGETVEGVLQPGYMTTAYNSANPELGGAGCSSASIAILDSKYFAVKGTNCELAGKTNPEQTDFDNVYVTYGAVASNEGIKAAKGVAPIDSTLSNDCSDPLAQREIVNVANCNFTDAEVGGIAAHTCSSTKTCGTIQLGASDVEGSSFTQSSSGKKFGWLGDNYSPSLSPESTTGLTAYKPTVVPFAFYVNNDILTYNQDFDNLTRTQAINLFAGNINNWTKLPGFDSADAANLGVQICLRHAGSGTHATLDKAVFRGDANIKKTAVTIGTAAKAYFFQSSSSTKTAEPGMLQCIESNGNRTSGYVAVGYLDADAVDDDMLQLKYQGVAATSENIIKGAYDFWSQQTLYALNNTNAVKSLTGYASADIPNSKEGVWVPAADLKVTKSTDESIPTNF